LPVTSPDFRVVVPEIAFNCPGNCPNSRRISNITFIALEKMTIISLNAQNIAPNMSFYRYLWAKLPYI